MKKEVFIETVLGGLRPLALLCRNREDAVLLWETVGRWSDELMCASESKELATASNKQSTKLFTREQVVNILLKCSCIAEAVRTFNTWK